MSRKMISLAVALALMLPCATVRADPGVEGASFLSAKAVAVLEPEGLQAAVELEADKVVSVAGLARLPMLIYICEAFDRGAITGDAQVLVSDAAAGIGGPTAFIKAGERIAALALIKAAVMITAGDASFALAESVAGSTSLAESAIAGMLTDMNIGSGDFSLASGKEKMSAREVCALLARLAHSDTYRTYSALTLDEITHENGSKTELANPNKLIKSLEGCYAGSTGSSNEAGYCGAFAITRGDTSYVVAILGAANSNDRFAAAKEAAGIAFASFEAVRAASTGDVVAEGVAVNGGMQRSVDAVSTKTVVLLLEKGDVWTVSPELPESVAAPVNQGDIIGYAVYSSQNGMQTMRVALAAAQDVGAAGWGDLIAAIMRAWVRA